MEPVELTLGALLSYVWAQACSWNGFIQLLWLLQVLCGAAWRLTCALLYSLFYYWDAVLLYFLQEYCGLGPPKNLTTI